MKEKIKVVQQLLAEKGLYRGAIDGIFGPETLKSLNRVPGMSVNLPNVRKVTTMIQIGAREKGFNSGAIDGMWGPQTQYAFEELVYLQKYGKVREPWRPEEINPMNRWPRQNSPAFHEFYGLRAKNLVTVTVPYEMKIAWDMRYRAKKITCHSKVAESLLLVLENVRNIYGENEIERLALNRFGGCFNNRLMRGGTQWSTHSWGVALDFDPARNQLTWGRNQAAFAHPVYNDWWRCWEEEGWVSLGRRKNYDWMHVQAAEV
tara:strand:- start:150 stop:932 length:783 start_codon:yes stop_codon:yes gene_type:complete